MLRRMPSPDTTAVAALDAIRAACRVCRAVSAGTIERVTKADESPVTVADFASQAVIVARLRERVPDAVVIGEESADELRSDDRLAEAVVAAARVDTVVVSLDGPRDVHDSIRRVKGGFDRLSTGVNMLRAHHPRPRLIARSVLQRANASAVAETIAAANSMGFDEMSFLAADVSSTAFNRPDPWPSARVSEIAVPEAELDALSKEIDRACAAHSRLVRHGFVTGGRASLERIVQYYRALAGPAELPIVQCNAPWTSAVLEPGDVLRPCFFQPAYAPARGNLEAALNGDEAVAFRRSLDVGTNDTCRRCVCSLHLPLTRTV